MRICITGITGSFGRAFARLCLADPEVEALVGLSRDEVKQGDLIEEFGEPDKLKMFLGNVRDRDRLVMAFRGCDAVVHAAALKRVTYSPISSGSPGEMLKTNILGSVNVIHAAMDAGISKVLLISSDKAVHATNLYGASKFCAEAYAVQANVYSQPMGTRISVVRWGNVFGSRGSVVHIFKKQAARGDLLAITDPRMTRFCITLQEAAAFAMSAIWHLRGGEIWVPVLPSFRVVDLAAAIMPEQERIYVGLRAGGEKLHEWLLSEEEVSRAVSKPSFGGGIPAPYVISPSHQSWGKELRDGIRLYEGFRYTSDANDRWLRVDELRKMAEEVQE